MEVFMSGGIGLGGNFLLIKTFVVPYYLFKNPNVQGHWREWSALGIHVQWSALLAGFLPPCTYVIFVQFLL